MSKVAVIGGAGFLGSHIADELTARSHDVLIYDIQPSKWAAPNQKMIIGDCMDMDTLQRNLEGCEFVYHCAGIADIGDASSRPLDTIKSNILGTANVLEACIAKKISRIFFASSMYVYSDEGSFYSLSKKAAENLVETYSKTYDLNYTVLRYGSMFGSRAQSWNPITKIVKQALGQSEITLNGTGKEKREYIHISDAARLSVDVLAEEFINQSVIVSGNQTFSTADLIAIVQEITGESIAVDYNSKGSSDRYQTTPYKFTPKPGKRLTLNSYTDLGQGLLSLVESFYDEASPRAFHTEGRLH